MTIITQGLGGPFLVTQGYAPAGVAGGVRGATARVQARPHAARTTRPPAARRARPDGAIVRR